MSRVGRKHKYGYMPIRTKFIVLFCLMITIPFAVIGTITYHKYSSNVEQNTRELTHEIVGQINVNLDRYVKEIERLTLAPLYDETVMSILKNHSGPYQELIYLTTDETLKMNLFISSLVFDRTEIEGVLIFTNDGGIFSNLGQSIRKSWRPEGSAWMQSVKEQDGGLSILPRHSAAYYTGENKEVVSIARVIREPYSNRMLGIVKVDLTSHGLEKMLSPVSFNGKLFITDRSREVVYSTTDSSVAEAPDASYIRADASSDYTGLEVTALIPREALREDARDLSRFTLIISLIGLLFAYLIAVISSSRLVRPIAHLHAKMRLVQRGLLNERATVTTHDEIGQLTEGFNTMIGEIERLVREVYETRLREREAELSALQSQIHPHFLYNTLETMNMLALQGNREQLSDMIASLGKLLRYTVDRQEKQVYLQDEVRFVEAYLQIQRLRLGERLQTEIRIDSSYDYCQVPKLILQPLVENVIEHALGESTVRMQLTAHVEEDDLILTVKDNGIGLSPPRMQELEREWKEKQPDRPYDEPAEGGFGQIKKGFALRNVHQRIRLLYGEPYGLSLDRSVNQGAPSSYDYLYIGGIRMYKLFLVEDEAIIRSGLKQLVEEVIGGYQVIGEAANGKLALEALKVTIPDLLITDVRMNEMNGIEMIRRLRDQFPDLPIIILSGYAEFEYAKQALRYGIKDYLLKPIDRIELTQALEQFRRTREMNQPQSASSPIDEEGSSGRQLIRRLKELVAERLDQEISLQYMAEQVHLNHQYLSVLFKNETGQNFSDYVTECRMNRARQLLKETNLKIYEVARLSGYMSAKHFMAVFKETVGMTPTQYRNRNE